MLPNWISESVNSILSLYLAIALSILIAIAFFYTSYFRKLPPGPIGLPFLGYWPFINEQNCYLQLKALQRKHGDFYSLTATGHLYIFLGSHEVIREAHITKSDCFVDRFEDYNLLTDVFSEGFTFMNGEGWKVLRKFFLLSFKDRGLLSVDVSVASFLSGSIESAVQELKSRKCKPVDMLEMLTDKCNTILHSTLFGERGVSEKQMKNINEHFGKIMQCMTATNLLLTGNFARYIIFPWISGYREFKKSHLMIQEILHRIIEEHKLTYCEGNSRDIIDDYIKERNKRHSKGDPKAQHFTDKALAATLIQIIGDGVLSVGAFIAMFFKILMDHPEEQDKIYNELMKVIGPDRDSNCEDKKNLPYTNAFLLEAVRTSVFFPFFPSLRCNKETTIRGCRIPVGTITVVNTWATHNNPDVYDEPEKFKPERFLHKDGVKPEPPIMFGVGKHSCVAEHFAMMQVFLFLTSIIKNFRISNLQDLQDKNEPSFSGYLQLVMEPR